MAKPGSKKYWWLVLIVVPIVVALIQILPDLTRGDAGEPIPPRQGPIGQGQPQGEILSPKKGEAVASPFNVEGTLRDIPKDHHVWLAVQVDNLVWPKIEIPSSCSAPL